MFDSSRMAIYEYLCSVLADVTSNIHPMHKPKELSQDEVKNGFIVIKLDDINDESEFSKETYGWVSVAIEAYVPTKKRGRLNSQLFDTFESAIDSAIESAIESRNTNYGINERTILSKDFLEDDNANNVYSVYVKTFVLTIENNS